MKIACISCEGDRLGLSIASAGGPKRSHPNHPLHNSLPPFPPSHFPQHSPQSAPPHPSPSSIHSSISETNAAGITITSCELHVLPFQKTSEIVGILTTISGVSLVILSESCDEDLISAIETSHLAWISPTATSSPPSSIRAIRLSRSTFTDQSSQDSMLSYKFSIDEPDFDGVLHTIREYRHRQLIQMLGTDVPLLYRSLGALLSYLRENSVIDPLRFYLSSRVSLTKNILNRVSVSAATLRYLSIFREEIHPSMIKGQGKIKEGYSIYMLFAKHIRTKLGCQKLKHLFLTPTFDLPLLKSRHCSIAWVSELSPSTLKQLKESLPRTCCIGLTNLLKKLNEKSMGNNDWVKLKNNLEAISKVLSICLASQSPFINLAHTHKLLEEAVGLAIKTLEEFFSFNIKTAEVTIRQGLLPALDQAIELYEKLADVLEQHQAHEQARVDDYEHDSRSAKQSRIISLHYFPILGFYVAVQSDHSEEQEEGEEVEVTPPKQRQRPASVEGERGGEEDSQSPREDDNPLEGEEARGGVGSTKLLGLPEDYHFAFHVEGAMLFKCDLTNDIEESYGDIHCRILDMQRDVLREVEEQVGLPVGQSVLQPPPPPLTYLA